MDNPFMGSDQSGSPTTVPAPTPEQGTPAGEAAKTGGDTSEKNTDQNKDQNKDYGELESRLGQQGQELGEYRQFFQNISPLLDKLNQQPDLVQAIIDGKVDDSIAAAVMEGRIDIRDAAIVHQANE